jgi:D-3-phosphoglycerate dehydrogenase
LKVVFIDSVHTVLVERLIAAGMECELAWEYNKEQIINSISDAQGIVLRSRFTMNEAFLQFAPNLKFIARSGSGLENIDLNYCTEREIKVYNSPEGNRNAVGEHALGMLLSLMNHLHTADRDVRSGIWDRDGNRGVELDGKTVGIIGFGNNGSAFAKKLRGFDIKLMAYDKYKKGFGDHFVMECAMSALFEHADIISFHIPQNKETLFMANEAFFNTFHKPIFLLNLSRGKIVETKALVNAIKSGKVLGAGLDVLEFEPTDFTSFFQKEIPNELEFLLNANNVILTPHVGGWTNESYYKLSNVLADKILNDFNQESTQLV